MLKYLALLSLVGLAAPQGKLGVDLPYVYRNQVEYKASTPCPTQWIADPNAVNRDGYKMCTKANIANCPQGSEWYSPKPRCQHCVCNQQDGDNWVASCNKVDCEAVPAGTDLPGKGSLKSRKLRYNCRRTDPKVCPDGCDFLARDRRCVYCQC